MRLWGSELYGHPDAQVPPPPSPAIWPATGGQGVSPLIGQGGFKKIAKNEPVLFDYVFAWQGYISDHTRVFSIGPLPDELLRAHAYAEIQEG
jgi:hypothetical protein